MDDYAVIGRAISLYMEGDGHELGVSKPVREFLPELTTIVEGIIGVDTTNKWWAYDEKAFGEVARHPQFRAALEERGFVLSLGESCGEPHVTISRMSEP